MKAKIKNYLLELKDKGYNLRWVQAIHQHKYNKEYLSFFDTQTNLDLGLLEITKPIQDNIGDLIREVKYPLLEEEVLEEHLKGVKKVAPKVYNKYSTFFENTILENIDLEAYDIHLKEPYDKVQEVYKIFKSEYLHGFNRNRNQVITFKDWLQGLPSVLTIPFMNYDILENAKAYGKDLSTEAKEDAFLESYWENCAKAFFTLKENL